MADGLNLPPPLAGDARFQALGTVAGRLNAIDLQPLLVYLVDGRQVHDSDGNGFRVASVLLRSNRCGWVGRCRQPRYRSLFNR